MHRNDVHIYYCTYILIKCIHIYLAQNLIPSDLAARISPPYTNTQHKSNNEVCQKSTVCIRHVRTPERISQSDTTKPHQQRQHYHTHSEWKKNIYCTLISVCIVCVFVCVRVRIHRLEICTSAKQNDASLSSAARHTRLCSATTPLRPMPKANKNDGEPSSASSRKQPWPYNAQCLIERRGF